MLQRHRLLWCGAAEPIVRSLQSPLRVLEMPTLSLLVRMQLLRANAQQTQVAVSIDTARFAVYLLDTFGPGSDPVCSEAGMERLVNMMRAAWDMKEDHLSGSLRYPGMSPVLARMAKAAALLMRVRRMVQRVTIAKKAISSTFATHIGCVRDHVERIHEMYELDFDGQDMYRVPIIKLLPISIRSHLAYISSLLKMKEAFVKMAATMRWESGECVCSEELTVDMIRCAELIGDEVVLRGDVDVDYAKRTDGMEFMGNAYYGLYRDSEETRPLLECAIRRAMSHELEKDIYGIWMYHATFLKCDMTDDQFIDTFGGVPMWVSMMAFFDAIITVVRRAYDHCHEIEELAWEFEDTFTDTQAGQNEDMVYFMRQYYNEVNDMGPSIIQKVLVGAYRLLKMPTNDDAHVHVGIVEDGDDVRLTISVQDGAYEAIGDMIFGNIRNGYFAYGVV